ncbi:trypsin-like serine protease [Mesorhizobium sp. GbtcB19]|uniref:trypsin-like serine protease n=1 Tax=Mesorhizobium sp. GbtcB19 TaxID=2824764 RepID=UPI001C2F8E5A|nr:trypsin-like serine protease [Mesorhizobium sp. GbtcB19]
MNGLPGRGLYAVSSAVRLAFLAALLVAVCMGPVAAEDDPYQTGTFQTLQAGTGAPSVPDDREGQFSPQMINAAPVPSGVYQDVVRITFRPSPASDQEAVCTGTLLHDQHAVLTAGHCSCGVIASYRFIDKRTFDLPDDPDTIAKFTLRPVREAVRFPGYVCDDAVDNAGRDLALFFVQSRQDEKDGEDPTPSGPLTRVASMHAVYASGAKQLTAAGYGITQNGTFSRTLERGRIDIGSYFCSQGNFGGTPCAGFHEFVLGRVSAGSTGIPVDTCNGDSGGPVYWYPPEQTDAKGKTFLPPPALVGVTSRALIYADHLPGMLCGGGGVYTAIGHSDVLNWLWSFGVHVRTVELTLAPEGSGNSQ